MATAGVGFISGWFLGRVVIPRTSFSQAYRKCLQAFGLLFAITCLAGCIGYAVGFVTRRDPSPWETYGHIFGITDLPAFVHVATIHQAGYLGALLGCIGTCIWLARTTPRSESPE